MSDSQSLDDFRKSIDWEGIFHSDVFKALKRNRFKFVVPSIIGVSLAFTFLWTAQNYLPGLANMQVIGNINFAFLFTMALFPLIWLAGFAYTRYVGAAVEPHEQEILDRYGMKEAEDE
ncbi:MAG: DUF485 domain-containing protein [Coriobacteriaceae bacterium]|jgi:uncharacterized membrane protein (DUF485 family)|nr:DUF485 domain-containing protein [Coriobacteriaceae bacterium]